MKLWLISQEENTDYDTFDSAVVCYGTEVEARNHRPGGGNWGDQWSSWCSSPDKVAVEYLGEASPHLEQGLVIASFNASQEF